MSEAYKVLIQVSTKLISFIVNFGKDRRLHMTQLKEAQQFSNRNLQTH